MQNKYDEFIAEIILWETELPALLVSNPKIIELAFLKIYVKFEQLLIEAFVHYATGGEGKNGYKPIRRLEFSDITHLEKVVKKTTDEFIDVKRIKQIARSVFDDNNPFTKFFDDAQADPLFQKMTVIRNYLAHESNDSRSKYNVSIMNAYNISVYEEPYTFLSKENSKYYNLFVTTLKNYAGVILECPPA
jgi:hypothetical protein